MKNNSFKKILSNFVQINVLLVSVLFCNVSRAQNCLVHSLDISTGHDPQNMVSFATNNPDPKWRVSALSPACQSIAGITTFSPYAARMINSAGGWTPNNGWRLWISFMNN